MKRPIFIRLAAKVLRSFGDPQAREKAEAIAREMDELAEVLGDGAEPEVEPPAFAPPVPRTAFPAANPAAIVPVEPSPPEYDPQSQDNLIIGASTIPDRVERVAPPPPPPVSVRSLRTPPSTRMKVEELNQLIQERTPPSLGFDVPMGDGRVNHVTFQRDVRSRHAEDCVQLVYFPPSASLSAREASTVQASIHVDDLPVDLSAILKDLKAQAINAIRPKGQILSAPPMAPQGPVLHPADMASSASIGAAQGVFDSAAAIASPPIPRQIESEFHHYK